MLCIHRTEDGGDVGGGSDCGRHRSVRPLPEVLRVLDFIPSEWLDQRVKRSVIQNCFRSVFQAWIFCTDYLIQKSAPYARRVRSGR